MKEITLKSGQIIHVDDVDYEFVLALGTKRIDRWGYLTAAIKGSTRLVHRLIAERAGLTIQGIQIDHRDTNKLNNCRINLRQATQPQNQQHRGPTRTNKTGYKGVWPLANNKFEARIKVRGRLLHLGIYSTPREAAAVYNQAAITHFDRAFVWLNRIAERRTSDCLVKLERRVGERRGGSDKGRVKTA